MARRPRGPGRSTLPVSTPSNPIVPSDSHPSNNTSSEGVQTEPELIGEAADFLRPRLRSPDEAVAIATKVVTTIEMRSGPMPPPQDLKAYEDVSPGAALALISMADSEQKHRHRMQMLEILYPYAGIASGLISLLAMIAGAVYLGVNNGPEKLEIALVGLPALGVVGWFIKARILPTNQSDTKQIAEPENKSSSPRRRR